MPKVIVADKVYIPRSMVDMDRIRLGYERHVYKEATCSKCSNKPDRFNDICASCPAYKGFFRTWKAEIIKEKKYVGLPKGDYKLIRKLTGIDITKPESIIDKRSDVKALNPLTFTKKLYKGTEVIGGVKMANQRDAVKQFWKHKYGLLLSKPRTGKCLTADALIPTANGFKYINNIVKQNKNIRVATWKGTKRTKGLYAKKSATIRVTSSNGYTVEGSPEHKLLVLTANIRFVWRRLDKIKVGDTLILKKGSPIWSSHDKVSKIQAEFLGYIIANGNMVDYSRPGGFISISTQNEVIAGRLSLIARKLRFPLRLDDAGDTPAYVTTGKYMRQSLIATGLLDKKVDGKTIPKQVLASSKEVLTTFLSAYFSCDSYIPDKGEIELCSASLQLIHELQTVLLAYGIITRFMEKTSWARNSETPIKKQYYHLFIGGTSRKLFLATFKIRKKYVDNNTYSDAKYLVDQLPLVRHALCDFKEHNSERASFEVGKKVIRLRLPTVVRGKNRMTRDSLRQVLKLMRPLRSFDTKLFKNLDKIATRDDLFYDTITDIKVSKIAKPVFDISVPDALSYIANGTISHNTVMATRLICAFKRRTLFLVHEKELAKQALRTVRSFTNVKELEAQTGRKIVGILQKPSDWNENWDIMFSTYQKFITTAGRKLVRKHIHGKFGLLIVDEVHRANANAFSNLINFIDTRYGMGLTATNKRKDQLEFIVEQLIGPTVVETEAEGLVPTVKVHYTGFAPKQEWRGMTAYVNACSWLATHKARNILLINQIFRDLRDNPKNCIVVPVMRVEHAKYLVKLINKQGQYNNEHKKEKWSKNLAIAYIGASDKTKVMQAAREGTKTRVTIAIRTKVQEGIDVIPWNIEYLQFPINNETNFYQMTQRICTAAEDKPPPLLRIFVDDFGLSLGCFKSTWFGSVLKLKYKVTQEEFEKAKEIINMPSKSARKGNTGYGGPHESIKANW
jgi:intein/homing endonuclease